MIFRNVPIEYSKCTDDLAADVREQGILEVVCAAESVQRLARVVGDRGGVYTMGLERCQRMLQLDELIAAVGSPIGAAAEDQQ
jgi:hypothetical protein